MSFVLIILWKTLFLQSMIPKDWQNNLDQPTKSSDVNFFILFFFCFSDFVVKMINERTFLDIADKFSLFGKKVSDIFWTCPLQLVRPLKIDRIADFIILVMWLWLLLTPENFTNINYRESINLYRFYFSELVIYVIQNNIL